ncbi:MAG: GrpB family protein [Anaerolineae bacterium]
MRNIIVVPYNNEWPHMFQQEAAEITAIVGGECLSIHHIGSTAIPGMSAKPIIDIMPRCV